MSDPRLLRTSDGATSDRTLAAHSLRGCGTARPRPAAIRHSHDHVALDHGADRSDTSRQRSTVWLGGRTVLGPAFVAVSSLARRDDLDANGVPALVACYRRAVSGISGVHDLPASARCSAQRIRTVLAFADSTRNRACPDDNAGTPV